MSEELDLTLRLDAQLLSYRKKRRRVRTPARNVFVEHRRAAYADMLKRCVEAGEEPVVCGLERVSNFYRSVGEQDRSLFVEVCVDGYLKWVALRLETLREVSLVTRWLLDEMWARHETALVPRMHELE